MDLGYGDNKTPSREKMEEGPSHRDRGGCTLLVDCRSKGLNRVDKDNRARRRRAEWELGRGVGCIVTASRSPPHTSQLFPR